MIKYSTVVIRNVARINSMLKSVRKQSGLSIAEMELLL
jgi:hypothetical protein